MSTNLDAGLEWYFTRRSLLSATAFYMDLENYIGYGTQAPDASSPSATSSRHGQDLNYLITTPINAKGRVYGAEFAYQQAITENFGLAANYTYADGKQTSNVSRRTVGNTVDLRRPPGGHLEDHLQHQRLLRELDVQCAGGLQLPLVVLQRS